MLNDHESSIILNMISGVGYARYRLLCDVFGSPAEILKQDFDSLKQIKGIGPKLADKIGAWRELDLTSEINMAERGGVEIITLDDDAYPETLREIHDPPICLYIRGQLNPDSERNIAIVGSRRASAYALRMTEHFAEQAVINQWTVISGLAFGIDAAAHRSVVANNGTTIGVLGGGLGRIHPQEHVPLAREIVEHGGALISEYPMMFPVSRQSFPRRNRIVSGLSRGILVMEAGLQSGALITAEIGLEQGKCVFALPGHIDNPQAAGCHKLIKNGAKLVDSFADITDEFELSSDYEQLALFESKAIYETSTNSASEVNAEPGSSLTRQIVQILNQCEQLSFDNLIIELNTNSAELLAALMELEMNLTVVQLPGRYYALRR